MCGIGGYSLEGGALITPSSLSEALAMLRYRGPDDCGLFEDSLLGVGLAHSRLSILDLSYAGHQPMQSHDGNSVIVFNGEIYNFQELRDELEFKGFRFRGHSDTEILLALYQAEGESMLSRLNGIFAFAIFDLAKQRMFLARDALGVKPLYYAALDDRFVFASEIKALLPLLPNPGHLDQLSLDKYLTYLWCPGEGTPLQFVRKLLPGHAMCVMKGHVERRWSWYQLPSYQPIDLRCLDKDSLIKRTVDHLRAAVNRQLVSDVPVGAFLSGGLDSSSIVALAREHNPNLHCFTIDVRGNKNDGFSNDLPFANRVAKHLGVSLDVVKVDSSLMAASLEEMVWRLDEPLADPAPLNVLYISQLARDQGIKVLLSGAGGDDLFTGYRRHLAVSCDRYWAGLPRPLRIQLRKLTAQLPARYPLCRRIRKVFSGAHLDPNSRILHYFKWIERPDLDRLYTPSFREAIVRANAEDPMLEFLESLAPDTPLLERMLALEKRFFLADHNLNYTDKMSMSVGVEVRVPFLDHDLVNFAARIPASYKQRGRDGKWILKKAMEAYLPHDVIYRPKSGFGAPLRHWLRIELRDWLADILSPDRLKNRGLFDPHAVRNLMEANIEGKVDASYTLLSLACIEIWCQHFLDRTTHHPSIVF